MLFYLNKRAKKGLLLLFIIILFIILGWLLLFFFPYPDLEQFLNQAYSVKVVDRYDKTIQVLPLANGERREYIAYSQIPQEVVQILIKSEDKRFYYHFGIDFLAILRAFYMNIKYNKIVSGSSTITMQLSRLVTPHEHGYWGKILEIINALRIEAKLSKKQIIELWLNSIPFGNNSLGIQAASETFFSRPVEQLDAVQILLLAVIPRGPSFYNFHTQPENAIKAALKLGKQIKMDIQPAMIEQAIKKAQYKKREFHAPHFVQMLINEGIINRYKNKNSLLKTSLDLELNQKISADLGFLLKHYEKNRLTNGAVLVINNTNGEVLAYVGSKDFFDQETSGQIDGIRILNQPGSTLKPFLYALAIEKGFLPNTILPDIPSQFGSSQVYVPQNFNRRYHGPVRLRVALASSLNVPAIYLITRLGVKNFASTLIKLGFESLIGQEELLGSGLALGNNEVSLFELTRAFTVFPGEGKLLDPSFLKKNSSQSKEAKTVFSRYTSAIICNILSDHSSRVLGFGDHNLFNTTRPAIFKTGTSDQFNNIWALGATQDFTVGVWMGNFSGATVIGRTGSSVPAQLAVQILNHLSRQRPYKNFKLPDQVKKVIICSLSGEKITSSCPNAVYEYLPADAHIKECNWHVLENGKISNHFPPVYASFFNQYQMRSGNSLKDDQSHYPSILSPKNEAVFYFDPSLGDQNQALKVEILNDQPDELIRIFLNQHFIKEIQFPYEFFLPLKKGSYQLEARHGGNSDQIYFTVK